MSVRARGALAVASWVLLFSLLTACASIGARLSIAPPRITVEGIAVGGVQGTDAIVTLSLRVENPNGTELMLHSLRFALSINDIALTSGTTVRSETVPAGGSALIEVETRTNINAVLQLMALSASRRTPPLRYSLEGEAVVQNDIRLPFARRGDIPMPAGPPPPAR